MDGKRAAIIVTAGVGVLISAFVVRRLLAGRAAGEQAESDRMMQSFDNYVTANDIKPKATRKRTTRTERTTVTG